MHHHLSTDLFVDFKGNTLVEALVAVFISALMVTAIFGVGLSSKQATLKNTHRVQINQALSSLSAQVKQYVTACCTTAGDCSACAGTGISGPNTNSSSTWSLNNASVHYGTAPSHLTDSAGDVWALACGVTHTVKGLVPSLEASPYNLNVSYTVVWPSCGGNEPGPTDVPQATFTVHWDE